MHLPLSFCVVDREGLATFLGNFSVAPVQQAVALDLTERSIPKRGAILGQFGTLPQGPLPDFMVVRDEDLNDTYAWVSAFFAGMTPVTQWCRIWKQSEFGRIDLVSEPRLGDRLGPWIGAVIAECLVQANYRVNLKDLPGSAALAAGTFAAARASAIWGDLLDIDDLVARYDELSVRVRTSTRPLMARDLAPLWHVLSDNPRPGRDTTAFRALRGVNVLLSDAASAGAENAKSVASAAAIEFKLPELEECVRGAQAQRVDAVDALANRLSSGPRSPVVEALLGFGASLVEPGVAVFPELLRRYADKMPMAPLWLGAFAGAWSPSRVINDHQGLGRLVLKALEARADLAERPTADIAMDELERWLGPAGSKRPAVRAMSARTMNVEIVAGVVIPFSVVPETATESVGPRGVGTSNNERRPYSSSAPARSNAESDFAATIRDLVRRVAQLESNSTAGTDMLPGLETPSLSPSSATKGNKRGSKSR